MNVEPKSNITRKLTSNTRNADRMRKIDGIINKDQIIKDYYEFLAYERLNIKILQCTILQSNY